MPAGLNESDGGPSGARRPGCPRTRAARRDAAGAYRAAHGAHLRRQGPQLAAGARAHWRAKADARAHAHRTLTPHTHTAHAHRTRTPHTHTAHAHRTRESRGGGVGGWVGGGLEWGMGGRRRPRTRSHPQPDSCRPSRAVLVGPSESGHPQAASSSCRSVWVIAFCNMECSSSRPSRGRSGGFLGGAGGRRNRAFSTGSQGAAPRARLG